jgi:hypothetical protein
VVMACFGVDFTLPLAPFKNSRCRALFRCVMTILYSGGKPKPGRGVLYHLDHEELVELYDEVAPLDPSRFPPTPPGKGRMKGITTLFAKLSLKKKGKGQETAPSRQHPARYATLPTRARASSEIELDQLQEDLLRSVGGDDYAAEVLRYNSRRKDEASPSRSPGICFAMDDFFTGPDIALVDESDLGSSALRDLIAKKREENPFWEQEYELPEVDLSMIGSTSAAPPPNPKPVPTGPLPDLSDGPPPVPPKNRRDRKGKRPIYDLFPVPRRDLEVKPPNEPSTSPPIPRPVSKDDPEKTPKEPKTTASPVTTTTSRHMLSPDADSTPKPAAQFPMMTADASVDSDGVHAPPLPPKDGATSPERKRTKTDPQVTPKEIAVPPCYPPNGVPHVCILTPLGVDVTLGDELAMRIANHMVLRMRGLTRFSPPKRTDEIINDDGEYMVRGRDVILLYTLWTATYLFQKLIIAITRGREKFDPMHASLVTIEFQVLASLVIADCSRTTSGYTTLISRLAG